MATGGPCCRHRLAGHRVALRMIRTRTTDPALQHVRRVGCCQLPLCLVAVAAGFSRHLVVAASCRYLASLLEEAIATAVTVTATATATATDVTGTAGPAVTSKIVRTGAVNATAPQAEVATSTIGPIAAAAATATATGIVTGIGIGTVLAETLTTTDLINAAAIATVISLVTGAIGNVVVLVLATGARHLAYHLEPHHLARTAVGYCHRPLAAADCCHCLLAAAGCCHRPLVGCLLVVRGRRRAATRASRRARRAGGVRCENGSCAVHGAVSPCLVIRGPFRPRTRSYRPSPRPGVQEMCAKGYRH